MTDENYDNHDDHIDRAQAHLASLKRDMRKTLEDATVRAAHKVMADLPTAENLALEALEEIALAGMSVSPEMIDSKEAFHARQAWRFIGIAARALEPIKKALANEALDKKADNARELGLDYEPAQKPVAYLCENAVGHQYFRWKKPSSTYKPIALYTSPPAQRTWVGLTDEDIEIAFDDTQEGGGFDDFARAIEAKLKEKNT